MFTEQLQAQIQMAHGQTAVKIIRSEKLGHAETMEIELADGKHVYIRLNANGSYTMVS